MNLEILHCDLIHTFDLPRFIFSIFFLNIYFRGGSICTDMYRTALLYY